MNVAEFVVSIVHRLGTDTAFCLTGGMAMHINRAIAESSMQVIYNNHEQAVAAAADGYAKAKNYKIPGLAVVTSGPGVMNTVNSVASAYYDSVPLYILAGQVKTADINPHGVRSYGAQETPQLEVLSLITKCAFRYDPKVVSDEQLAANMAQAMAGRKGPVYLDIPLDIQPQQVANAEARLEKIMQRIAAILAAEIKDESAAAHVITEELAEAKRPAVVIGNGFHIAGFAHDDVRFLVEKLGIPALFTWPSSDLLPFEHDLNFGCAGGLAPTHANRIIQNADLLIFLGVRLDLLTTGFNAQNYGKNAKRLIVECEAKEISKNAGLKNATIFAEDLRSVVAALKKSPPQASKPQAWLAEASNWRADDRVEEDKAFANQPLTTYTMARVLSDSPNAKYIVPTGSGFAIEGFARFVRHGTNAIVAFAGHCLGSMGLALPMAIGAAAGLGKPVICLEGDGGMLFNVQELYTLAANPSLPLTIIVMNNGGYQSIVKSQNRAFGKEFGASDKSGLARPDFAKMAASVGMPHARCTTVEEFRAVLNQPDAPRQRMIEVMLQEDGYRGPAVATKFDANGKPYSTDIGDVTWAR